MERTELFDLMGALKLYGMRASYDEVMAAARKTARRTACPERESGRKQDLLPAKANVKFDSYGAHGLLPVRLADSSLIEAENLCEQPAPPRS